MRAEAVEVHVIPVPHGYTAFAAWQEISTLGHLAEYRWWRPRYWRCRWAVVEVLDKRFPLTQFRIVNYDAAKP